MSNMTGASNKPFDYMAAGLALLVSDLPDWKTMFVDPGFGLACDPTDADSLLAALAWFIDHPDGVSLDLCERVSSRLNDYRERYTLEVSSPGQDRP